MTIARKIVGARWFFVIFWGVLAVVMAPFAFMLLFRVTGGLKEAPPGTESYDALQSFGEHFADLADIRYEKVVFTCRKTCFTADNDMARGLVDQVSGMINRFNHTIPGSVQEVQSFYTFAAHHADDMFVDNQMLSGDRQSILLQWIWTPNALKKKDAAKDFVVYMQGQIEAMNQMSGDEGMDIRMTGLYTLDVALKTTLIEEIVVHEMKTIWLPFCILAMALQSPRMLLLALVPMGVELPIGLGIMYFVSLETTVLLYAVEMMLMLMTSLSFDYALFLLTRYAEERRNGADTEAALITMVSQVGRVVLTSGLVLVISWASMLGLPGMFASFAIASGTMILICVAVQLTFVPSLLALMPFLGPPATERVEEEPDTPNTREVVAERARSRNFPDHEDALANAKPHMRGPGFMLGGVLTAFPVNVILPILVYTVMMPFSQRFFQNFDITGFRFNMGHLYETQVPRESMEWETALKIQEDFPNPMGVLMPMMIMATTETDLPTESLPGDAVDANGHTMVDVRKQAFFNANCQMINTLIKNSKETAYPLTAQNILSLTFHGENEDGTVKCMDYWKVALIENNWALGKLLHQTQSLAKVGWQNLVSPGNHAMLTLVFPPVDPFSSDAFALGRQVRETLQQESKMHGMIPGLSFKAFSAGTAVMDIIDLTEGCLPIAFLTCAGLSFLLVAVMFGAMFIPFKLIFTVLVPITWTYGAALFVYEDGVAEWMGITALTPKGDSGLDWTVPVFTLTFLVGLALDYDVFLFERVREFRMEGFGDREAIQLGLSATGGTISSAGLIMAFSFGGCTLLGSIPNTNQLGFVLVWNIVLDTFIVRTILTPCLLSLGSWVNYWPSTMPTPKHRWLGVIEASKADESAHEEEDGCSTASE